jgi:RND family efflux transporter MFP subunit
MKTIYLIIIAFLFAACNHAGHHHHAEDAQASEKHAGEIIFSAAQAEAAGLTVQTVAPETFSEVIKTSGQLLSAQGDEMLVVAASSGVVTFTDAVISEGAAVKAGQTLLTISARNMADGDPAMKAKVTYETALKDYERAKSLVSEQIISTKDFEQAQLHYETAKTAYNAQSGQVTADGLKVISTLNGSVKNVLVREGAYVSAGQPLLRLSKNKRLQLRAEVPAKYFKTLQTITDANFKVSYSKQLYTLKALNGRLLSVGNAVTQGGSYIPVTFEFDHHGDFAPGSFAEIYLLTTPQDLVIALPLAAITEEQGLHFVYLQTGEDDYKKQEVTLGADNGERVRIVSGLAPGDRVVTHGVMQVKLAATASVIPEGHSH